MNFLKKFNDYSCVEARDPDIDELYHFTQNAEAVKNIVTGCFWATDIRDFRENGEDENEGYLILCQVLDIICDMDVSRENIVQKIIGTDDLMNRFFDKHETYVVSTCINSDSSYMWDKYAKGEGYKIVLDKKKLINSLYIVLKNGKIRTEIFKHAQLLYDFEAQMDIIKKEYQGLIENQDEFLTIQDNMEYILEHLMYIGNFYKKGDKDYLKEDEYRILVNTSAHGQKEVDEFLPERKLNSHNNKHYIEIRFSPEAVKKIVCATQQAKKKIEDEIQNIEIEIKYIGKEG